MVKKKVVMNYLYERVAPFLIYEDKRGVWWLRFL